MAGDSMVVTALSASFVRRRIRKTGYQKTDICGIDTITIPQTSCSLGTYLFVNKRLAVFMEISYLFHRPSRLFMPLEATVRSVFRQHPATKPVDANLTDEVTEIQSL